jgi:flagellar protein FliS
MIGYGTPALADYRRDGILSASPARLLTMLVERLLTDLRRAEKAQTDQRWEDAGRELLHAQDIVAELTSSLDADAWDGGPQLLSIYGYVTQLLVRANVGRDPGATGEAIALMTPLCEAWVEAARLASAAPSAREEAGIAVVA